MILVTGGTGILGSTLVKDLLANEEKIRVLYRSEKKLNQLKLFLKKNNVSEEKIAQVNFFQGDITQYDDLESALQGISKVYHCANMVSFDEKDKPELYKVNVEGTCNLVNLCLEYKIEKFMHVSSIAVIDSIHENGTIKEDGDWEKDKIHSSYESSKYLGEMEVWRASQEGLDVVIVNPGVILNSYDFEQSSGALFKAYASSMSFYTSGNIPLVDVKDVSARMIYLMASQVINERFILVAENMDYKDLAFLMRNIFRLNKPKYMPKIGMQSIVFLKPIIHIFTPLLEGLNFAMLKFLYQKSFYNNTKINSIYPNQFINTKDSVQDYGAEYKKLILK